LVPNDPYVKFEVEKDFADTISNKQYVVKNAGHINSESGYTEFNEILEEI
jgi:predicted alpha/beta hydrolase family esterase